MGTSTSLPGSADADWMDCLGWLCVVGAGHPQSCGGCMSGLHPRIYRGVGVHPQSCVGLMCWNRRM